MTFSELRKKLFHRIWLPILFAVIATSIMFGFFNKPTFVSTITVGMPTRSNNFSFNLNYDVQATSQNKANDVSINSLQTVLDTSSYLIKRYSSPDVQASIFSRMNISVNNLSRETPGYEIASQGLGYVNLSYKSTTREQAESFKSAVIDTHKKIIDEWNSGRSDDLKVQYNQTFEPLVYQVSPNMQSLIIPIIASFVFGLLIILIWPYQNKDQKKS